MKIGHFINGFTAIFNLNSKIEFGIAAPEFLDKDKSLQQQYWELTGSHIRKQISVADKEY